MVLYAFYSSLYCIVKLAQKGLVWLSCYALMFRPWCSYKAVPGWGTILTGSLCNDASPAVSAPVQDVRKYWWCLVFIFRVNLLLILCLREEAVSHAKTNECENPHGMIGSLHLHIIAWWLNIPFPYKTHILFSKYTASRFSRSFDLCFAMV